LKARPSSPYHFFRARQIVILTFNWMTFGKSHVYPFQWIIS
jgi:hypothetical protein